MTKYNITMTDSFERALLNSEVGSYYNDRTLFSWIGTLVKNTHAKLVSFIAAVSTDVDSARDEGHKITAV